MSERRRASRGCTYDPYPCCGKPASEHGGRLKNRICDDCKKLIETGRDALKAAREDRGEENFTWVSQPHFWPMYYGPHELSDRTRRGLSNAMYELVNTLSTVVRNPPWSRGERAPKVIDVRQDRYEREGTITVSMKPEVRERLHELDGMIRKALAETHEDGKRRGRSALLNLAAGELSIADFDKGRDR